MEHRLLGRTINDEYTTPRRRRFWPTVRKCNAWESDFLHTEPGELYFALALFGLELTITWAARR